MNIDWNKVKDGLTTMDVLKEENKELKEEIERLNNIIKEVREYTNKMMTLAERKRKKGEENGALYVAVADILEILDREILNDEHLEI